MKQRRVYRPSAAQRGSIIVYIMIAIFLTGVLVAAMTQGANKSASSTQINAMMLYLQDDIKTVQSGITECVTGYSSPVDVNGDGLSCSSTSDAGCASAAVDNPNPPFPIYCANSTCALATMTSGGSGTTIPLMGCAGAPDGQRPVFPDRVYQNLKLLNDSSNYNATFINKGSEGVLLRITRAVADPLWSEAITRLDAKFSQCSAAAVTANPDPLGFNCSGGCFYYWVLRRSTSSSSFEAGCP
jgi:hypothetical protein